MKGGSLDNAIVVDENKVFFKHGSNFKKIKERVVNHKILDEVGDFYYLVINFGEVKCCHNWWANLFLRDLLENNKDNFSIIELETNKVVKIA